MQRGSIILTLILLLLSGCNQKAGNTLIEQSTNNKNLAIFVHGFTGAHNKTWGKLPELLKDDPSLDDYDFLFWGYPSKLFGKNESIGSLGQYLKTEIDYLPAGKYSNIVLVSHSMGGLVVRSLVVKSLIDGKGGELSRISRIVLFGTPNEGMDRAQYVPTFINDQILDMRLASKFIVELRNHWIRRVLSAKKTSDFERQIPTLVVAGLEDNFVPKESVLSYFPDRAVTDGDHVSMVKPDNRDHLSYKIIHRNLRNALEVTNAAGQDSANLKYLTTRTSKNKIFFTIINGENSKKVRIHDIRFNIDGNPIIEIAATKDAVIGLFDVDIEAIRKEYVETRQANEKGVALDLFRGKSIYLEDAVISVDANDAADFLVPVLDHAFKKGVSIRIIANYLTNDGSVGKLYSDKIYVIKPEQFRRSISLVDVGDVLKTLNPDDCLFAFNPAINLFSQEELESIDAFSRYKAATAKRACGNLTEQLQLFGIKGGIIDQLIPSNE